MYVQADGYLYISISIIVPDGLIVRDRCCSFPCLHRFPYPCAFSDDEKMIRNLKKETFKSPQNSQEKYSPIFNFLKY